MISICVAILFALCAASRWCALRRCTSCAPRCPNGHRLEISAMEGVMFAALAMVPFLLLDLFL